MLGVRRAGMPENAIVVSEQHMRKVGPASSGTYPSRAKHEMMH